VALWLAGQATRGTERALRGVLQRDPNVIRVLGTSDVAGGGTGIDETVPVSGPMLTELEGLLYRIPTFNFVVLWGKAEAAYAVQLLDRPRGEVAAALARNWSFVTRPSTTTDELVALLGLRRLPTYEQQLVQAGVAPNKVKEFLRTQTDPSQFPCP
jgi:hypothetical protein